MEGKLSHYSVDGYSIALEEFFSAHSVGTIFYLHGFLGAGFQFKNLIEHLPDYNHVLIDLPGHGRAVTEKGTLDVGSERFYRSLVTFLVNRNNNVPIMLYGYSMGARLALQCWLYMPGMIKKLFLESVNPGISDSKEALLRRQSDAELAKHLQLDVISFFDTWNANPMFSMSSNHALILRSQAMIHPFSASQWLQSFSTGLIRNMWPELQKMHIPVTLFAGEHDEKFVSIAKNMIMKLPQSSFFPVPESAHRPHIENPKFVAKKLRISL